MLKLFVGSQSICHGAMMIWQHAVSLDFVTRLQGHDPTLAWKVDVFTHLVRGWVFREPNVFLL